MAVIGLMCKLGNYGEFRWQICVILCELFGQDYMQDELLAVMITLCNLARFLLHVNIVIIPKWC